jgi:DNA-binding MarR family transcriptional regulator
MDGSGDNEKRLVRTVSLNDSDILAVSELLGQLVNRSQPQVGEAAAAGPQQTTDTDSQRIALAKAIRRARLRRTNYVSKAMLGEPAWDMLLALYVNDRDGPRLSVGRLATLSGAPMTTALRWIDYLAKERLICRHAHPTDRRSEIIELTDRARSALEQYLSETLQDRP